MNRLVSVVERPPVFLEKGEFYTPSWANLIPATCTRTPFSETDNEYYWMFLNPRTNEVTWRIICGEDMWKPSSDQNEVASVNL